jgi:hypothetical protein
MYLFTANGPKSGGRTPSSGMRSPLKRRSTIILHGSISQRFQSPLYLLFVDYSRAFDSVQRECIWRALEERGLPKKFINLIKEGYNNFQCSLA